MKNNNQDFQFCKIKKVKIKISRRINVLIIMSLKTKYKTANQPGH